MPVVPSIWFEGNAEEAMNLYVDTFPGSKILNIERYAGDQGIPGEKELKGKVLNGSFEVSGTKFFCLDGPSGIFAQGGGNISFSVEFDNQEELDQVWEKLLDGGKPQQCGWISDRFGVTWQIIPKALGELMSSGTPEQKQAVMKAMMPMIKMEIAPLQAAYDQNR